MTTLHRLTHAEIETRMLWTDSEGQKLFRVTAIWNPNEEDDAHVAYYNIDTGQEYTCRLEAFLARFFERPV